MELDSIFNSQDNFRQSFLHGLENMLSAEALGAYILVLANASFDADIFNLLQQRLQDRFAYWQEKLASSDPAKDYSADDVAVFRNLMLLGFDGLTITEQRSQGIWQLQYNLLRSFRPARNANSNFTSIFTPFDSSGFHFNKPFLQKEIFWQGDIFGSHVSLLYNKFPFARLHGLLVIDQDKNKPQYLTEADHGLVWQLLQALEGRLPMGMGYNAMGAFSSVNHQHFQSFVTKKKYPIELTCWQHNGGQLHYPLACRKFFQQQQAWDYIDSLQHANIPYNLFYRANEVYCVSRAFQGSYVHSGWTSGFAWSETAGLIATADRKDYALLDETLIQAEMSKMRRN